MKKPQARATSIKWILCYGGKAEALMLAAYFQFAAITGLSAVW
jgi:hypothetical protein